MPVDRILMAEVNPRKKMAVDSIPHALLTRLVQAGALVHDVQTDTVTMLGHAELLGHAPTRQLYWVAADAEDQHHSHAREFNTIEVVNGRALACHLRGQRVLYVASFADWPQYRTVDLAKTLAGCRRAQGGSAEARARWRRFIADCRPQPSQSRR